MLKKSRLVALRQYDAAHDWQVVGEYVDRASAMKLRGRTAWKRAINDLRDALEGVTPGRP